MITRSLVTELSYLLRWCWLVRFQSHYGLLLMFFECLPELDVRTLLVKISHIEHGKMKLVLTWKLDPYWVLSAGKGYAHYWRRKESILGSCEPGELQSWLAWKDRPTHALVEFMLWEQPTALWLGHALLMKPIPDTITEPMARWIIDSKRKPSTISLKWSIDSTPNDLSL